MFSRDYIVERIKYELYYMYYLNTKNSFFNYFHKVVNLYTCKLFYTLPILFISISPIPILHGKKYITALKQMEFLLFL